MVFGQQGWEIGWDAPVITFSARFPMKQIPRFSALLILSLSLCGCGAIGEKGGSISAAYGAMAILSFLILLGYCFSSAAKQHWFLLLLASVLTVNGG